MLYARAVARVESRRSPAGDLYDASAPVAAFLMVYEWTGPAVPQMMRLFRVAMPVLLCLDKQNASRVSRGKRRRERDALMIDQMVA